MLIHHDVTYEIEKDKGTKGNSKELQPQNPYAVPHDLQEHTEIDIEIEVSQDAKSKYDSNKPQKPSPSIESLFSDQEDDFINAPPIPVNGELPTIDAKNGGPFLGRSGDKYSPADNIVTEIKKIS